jgi:hypothetical protein
MVGIDHLSKNGYRFLSQLPQSLSRWPFLTEPKSLKSAWPVPRNGFTNHSPGMSSGGSDMADPGTLYPPGALINTKDRPSLLDLEWGEAMMRNREFVRQERQSPVG